MSDVRLTWDLPDVSVRQLPIDFARVEFRADESFPWTEQEVVTAEEPQQLLFVDVAPGTFFYQVTMVDTDGQESNPARTQKGTPFDPPGGALNLKATVE